MAEQKTGLLPQVVNDISMVFGEDINKLLPNYEDIPEDFKRNYGSQQKWTKIVDKWFFSGLPNGTQFIVKDNIDKNKALRHVAAIMKSFQPKHEHKTSGCSYLLSLWFKDIIIPEKKN